MRAPSVFRKSDSCFVLAKLDPEHIHLRLFTLVILDVCND